MSYCPGVSRALYKWAQLAGVSMGTMYVNAFCNSLYCPGVVELCTSGLNSGKCGWGFNWH